MPLFLPSRPQGGRPQGDPKEGPHSQHLGSSTLVVSVALPQTEATWANPRWLVEFNSLTMVPGPMLPTEVSPRPKKPDNHVPSNFILFLFFLFKFS